MFEALQNEGSRYMPLNLPLAETMVHPYRSTWSKDPRHIDKRFRGRFLSRFGVVALGVSFTADFLAHFAHTVGIEVPTAVFSVKEKQSSPAVRRLYTLLMHLSAKAIEVDGDNSDVLSPPQQGPLPALQMLARLVDARVTVFYTKKVSAERMGWECMGFATMWHSACVSVTSMSCMVSQ